jgi:hypothetical protein
MCCRTVARQGGQVGAINGRQKAGANHVPQTNPKIASEQANLRIPVESEYTISRFIGNGTGLVAGRALVAWVGE